MADTTRVGNFRQITNIDDGFLWNEDTAVKYFYKFIMPSKGKDVEQTKVKQGLRNWLLDSDGWEIEGFDLNTFNTINDNALKILEESSLDSLSDGLNFNSPDLQFAFKQFDFLNWQQKGGTGVLTINAWKRAIDNLKEEITILGQKEMSKGEIKRIFQNDDDDFYPSKELIDKMRTQKEKAIPTLEKKLGDIKNEQFNGNISLSQAINNQASKFYALYAPNPELDTDAAIALADAVDYEIVNFEDDPKVFFVMYGIQFNEYKKAVKAATQKLARLVTAVKHDIKEDDSGGLSVDERRLRQIWMDDSELQEEFNGDFNAWVKKEIVGNEDAPKYLQQLSERAGKQLESIRDLTPQESYAGDDRPDSPVTYKKKIGRRARQLKGSGKEEFLPYGKTMSIEEIKQSVGDVYENIDISPLEGWAGQSGKEQSVGEEYELVINKINNSSTPLVNFENVYTKHIGFTKDKSQQERVRGKPLTGSIKFNKKERLSKDMINNIPYIANLSRYQQLKKSLAQYSRRKVKTTAERMDDVMKKWAENGINTKQLNSDDYESVEGNKTGRGALPIIHGLVKLLDMDIRVGTVGIDREKQNKINTKIKNILGDYDDNYWYKGDKIKHTDYSKLFKKWKTGSTGEVNFQKNLASLLRALKRVEKAVSDFENEIEDEDENEDVDWLAKLDKNALKALAADNNIEVRGKSEAEMRNIIGEALSEKQLKGLEGQMQQEEKVEEAGGDSDEGILFDEDRGMEVFDVSEFNSELSIYLEELTEVKFVSPSWRESIKSDAKKIFMVKGLVLSDGNLIKSTRKLLEYLDFNRTQSRGLVELGVRSIDDILKVMGESTSEKENTEEMNNILGEFQHLLEIVWNEKSKDNKEEIGSKENQNKYFIPLLRELDLQYLLENKIHESGVLNNSHNGGIKMNADKLEIKIHFINKEISLRGSIDWTSKTQYKPQTKILDSRGAGITPSIGTLEATGQQKAKLKEKAGVSNPRITAAGELQIKEGDYVDVARMEWLNDVISNVKRLRRGLQ